MTMQSILEPPTDLEIHVWRVELRPGEGRGEARGALGRILADYLGEDGPPPLEIAPGGKPRLAERPGCLSFNLSHSGSLALVAVAPGGVEVGVDVERLKERRDLPRLAARWLSHADATAVATAPPGERERRFYAAWTRHEARVKCAGAGLAGPPPAAEITAWPLGIDLGYAAAVALDAPTEPHILLRDAVCRR
jgi:4'-phosphopantetheinyl transferase